MATLQFKFELYVDRPEVMPELQERVADLRPVFEEIVKKWARNNEEKFGGAIGAEASGAEVDPGVFWGALTESYIKRKRAEGYPDQIMVKTGELEAALEDTEGFFHEETAQEAAFGTPKSLEDEMKVRGNWEKRPVIFLGLSDQKAIEHSLVNYLSFGENWKDVIFARGMENVRRRNEAAIMDMGFNDAINAPQS